MEWTSANRRQPDVAGAYLCWVLRKDDSEQCAICHYSVGHWSMLNLNNQSVIFWMDLPGKPLLADDLDNMNAVFESR